MMDIIMLVFFVLLVNANDQVEMEVFGKEHEQFLRNHLELPNGTPSHDTIQRGFSMGPSEQEGYQISEYCVRCIRKGLWGVTAGT